jgi:hypothetical protein
MMIIDTYDECPAAVDDDVVRTDILHLLAEVES